ncbi:MAG: methylmalonyl Co-A mutase-associated GTPase MeaB [Balneolaceae bacterium]|nr:methylmalonyl Co-A mutase-associated GTPase MeaB [Balneolaceae bacterium]
MSGDEGNGTGRQPLHQQSPTSMDARSRGSRRGGPAPSSADDFLEGIRQGDRTMLSRAITLIESTRPGDRELATEIIEGCLPHTGQSVRVGITGVPGVGKSTFIEALGNHLLQQEGRRLAVLAIDPSSTRTKGSILGDKTRMETLANQADAFIRPSPTGGSLGGVARKTRETVFLCEAAGYDTVFIETVGVGQSETAVHSMVDFFLLLMLAGAGDELQGIKRGIMEMADLIAVNKSDSVSSSDLTRTLRGYKNALHLYPTPESGWKPRVTTCSALEGEGVAEIWETVEEYLAHSRESGWFSEKRSRQARHWMEETIRGRLEDDFYRSEAVREKLEEVEQAVLGGEMSSSRAASLLLERYHTSR